MLATILALLLAPPATAGWQFTTWKMTPDEVVAASEGTVNLLPEPLTSESGLVLAAVGKYHHGDFDFDVFFLFRARDDQLDKVVLKLTSGSALRLYDNLKSEHGEPFQTELDRIIEGQSHVAHFRDPIRNNHIEYSSIGEICRIEYTPLARDPGGF